MAFSTIACLFFFCLTLVLFSTQINARDSYSFGKFQRENPTDQNPNSLVPNQTNEKKEQDDQNPAFIPQSENGYGLYGHETTYNNNEETLNNNKNEETVNYDDSFSTPSLSETDQTQESYKNYRDSYPKPTEIYDNNNKDTVYYGNPDTYGTDKREKEAYKGYSNKDTSYYGNPNSYGTEKREKEAYKGYSNNVERQGMSDTRYMANGKYYYDLDDDRNHGSFYQNHYYNYKPTGYNEKKSNFKNPYDSNQQPEMFGEEQGDQFTP
ncbi:PREDICTED: protein E6-like isoform X1 [Camelina sativa]|uniref:Protein E6-like isoform X1 n=2 Tax=Camelina sativa TaxID=90675 RepID=A0ABM0Z3A3_CAMSA|nr:PREDICTED: protein E6-like isoform X1 [Camelina sativa]